MREKIPIAALRLPFSILFEKEQRNAQNDRPGPDYLHSVPECITLEVHTHNSIVELWTIVALSIRYHLYHLRRRCEARKTLILS